MQGSGGNAPFALRAAEDRAGLTGSLRPRLQLQSDGEKYGLEHSAYQTSCDTIKRKIHQKH